VKLLVIRHGPAGDRAAWEAQGRDDSQRPLTPDGRKQVRRAAAGLAALVPSVDVLATSPLLRAVQTAEIVAGEYRSDLVRVDALVPDSDPEETVEWLRELKAEETVALVGHEPHLGLLIGYLLTGKRSSFSDLKKAGAGLLDLSDPLRSGGGGTLEWLLTPRVLRRLGE
jgi:phosphohistidine phosphatase